MEQKKYDIFISYSSSDQKVVEGISGYLENYGYRCFVAFRDIPHGMVWAGAIAEAIDNSAMMVVVFSEQFNSSPQTDRELELAAENNLPILTYRISDTLFTGAKKYYLKNLHWIDAFPNPEKLFGALLSNIQKLIGVRGQERNNIFDNNSSQLLPPYNPKKSIEWYKVVSNRLSTSITQLRSSVRDSFGILKQYKKTVTVVTSLALLVLLFRWFAINSLSSGTNSLSYEAIDSIAAASAINDDNNQLHPVFKSIKESAESGNPSDEFRLGRCYYRGAFVPRDLKTAIMWWKKSAEHGFAEAQDSLGMCYYWGRSVNTDYGKAVEYFKKAADQDFSDAMFKLGYCYFSGHYIGNSYNKEDWAKALPLFESAAKLSHTSAMCYAGICYYLGQNGVAKNREKSFNWFTKAYQFGSITASYYLGLHYHTGSYVSKNYEKAFTYFIKAAQANNKDAQLYVGIYYQKGYGGIARDIEKARTWLEKSYRNGNKEAEKRLKEL